MTYTVKDKKTILVSFVGLLVCQSCFALEAISDQGLSEMTGEGIALLPKDFSFQFNGATSAVDRNQAIADNSNLGTGYLHIIPVGPLSQTIQNYNAASTTTNKMGKADIYLYGLALSKNDHNLNTRYSAMNISSWGTEVNPWVLKVLTAANIPDFSGAKQNVSYLTLESPLYDMNNQSSDDYNLKLGLWSDVLVRDSSRLEGDVAEFCLNGSAGCKADGSRSNRIRLQTVWNGLSINGSHLKLFQTLGHSSVASYNNTLGITGLLRLNTANNGVLRLSTQEMPASPMLNNLLNTPAIDGGLAPVFNATEGMYIHNPHINLVLGSVYQPMVLGVADDGKNIVLEVTRIPNVAEVYNQIYTDYDNLNSATYKGATCSQFECGTTGDNAKNPTHSSITIGNVGYSADTKRIMADTSATAKGITFQDGANKSINLGSASIDGVLIQHMKITTKGL